ncbi:hypothetical protein TSAR_006620 [Trichomalopsis sarcophagae]|uniref:acid phosphatase n=1 Tax=Trichomalopsis sarcophagae TaxID=543379 RepID=A0A232ESQ6_9HYME|nr:hypothetical protein TSAR_006620 [Trichomalopsis sarcophagae]
MRLNIFLCLMLQLCVTAVLSEVKQVSVVFRHGDRAPGNFIKSIPNDLHRNKTFYPMGLGGLTNNGKSRVYNLGKFLRSSYDDLLGPVYLINDVEAMSTDSPRARMSLQMALAGLYPPRPIQQWDTKTNWQPVLVSFKSKYEDKLLVPQFCEEYQEEYESVRNSLDYQSKAQALEPFMKELAKNMGRATPISVMDMNHLYHTLAAEQSMNLSLPHWADSIYPDGKLRDGALLQYLHYGYNDKLKRLSGGVVLQKIIRDMKAAQLNKDKPGFKIHVYSGHELNVVMLLHTLGLYNEHIPEYSSGVFIELHETNGEYYVKVLYYKGIPVEAEVQRIPGCDELCPFNKFVKLLENVTATETDLQCNRLTKLPK